MFGEVSTCTALVYTFIAFPCLLILCIMGGSRQACLDANPTKSNYCVFVAMIHGTTMPSGRVDQLPHVTCISSNVRPTILRLYVSPFAPSSTCEAASSDRESFLPQVYPDPVRVVSVGPVPHTIDQLLSEREYFLTPHTRFLVLV